MLGPALVGHGFQQNLTLADHHVFLEVGVGLVFEFEVVGGEGLDGEVGRADGSVFGDDVGGLGHASRRYVIHVLFVDLSHRYDMFIHQSPLLATIKLLTRWRGERGLAFRIKR